jgi:hypothetical protein
MEPELKRLLEPRIKQNINGTIRAKRDHERKIRQIDRKLQENAHTREKPEQDIVAEELQRASDKNENLETRCS